MKRGRKPKYSIEQRNTLLQSLNEYITATEIPILKEWCARNDIISTVLYDWAEFGDAIKKCHEKKEQGLERQALEGKVDKTMAIFSLKQFGWRDNNGLDVNLHVKTNQKQIEHAFDAIFAGGESKDVPVPTGVGSGQEQK